MTALNPKELDRLTSELTSFARSNIPLPEGLTQLQASLSPGKLKTLTAELAAATEQGRPLSEALAGASVAVPPPFAALVRCGEISGDMSGVLDFSLKHGRRLKQHRASMSTIFIYPILVLIVLTVIVVFSTVFMVPRFKDIYDQLGAEMPGPTQLIIDFSHFLATSIFGLLFVFVLTPLLLYLLFAAATERLPRALTEYLPGVRRLVYLSDTAVMTEFVGHLLSRGVPLPEACRAASLVVYHKDMRRSLEQMAETSEQGGESAEALNAHMPATAAWLYRQGEARGTLADACTGIARYCESRFDLLSRRTLYMMEPLFILVVALACGFVVIAFYLPLFNIPKIVGGG